MIQNKKHSVMGMHPVQSVKLSTLETNHQVLFSDARSRLVANNARGVTGRCETNARLMLAQSHRWWAGINPNIGYRLVSTNARGVAGRREINALLMLAQWCRRWAGINPTLVTIWCLAMPEA